MRATACSISTRRSAVASGPPASASGPAPRQHDVDPAHPLELVGGGDQEPAPHRLGARHPVADLAPEHDQIGARIAREPTGGRLVDGGQRHDQLRARLPQPRDLSLRRPRSDPRPCRRASPPAPGRRRRTRRPGRRPTVSSSDGATRGRRRQVDRQPRRDDVGRAAAHVGLGQPGRERRRACPAPSPGSARACASVACDFLGAGLRERQPAPVEHQHRAALPGGLAHQRRVARDVAQRIAGAAARLERPVDLARVEDRQTPLGGTGSGRGALGDGDHRRHQGDGREQSRERGAHGQHYGNPASPLAIPGLPCRRRA